MLVWLVSDVGTVAPMALSFIAQVLEETGDLARAWRDAILARTWCYSFDQAFAIATERRRALSSAR